MVSKLKPNIPAEAVVYTQLKIPSDISADIPFGKSLSDIIYKRIVLEVQGEAVEVSEEYPIAILMAIFDVVHKVCPEMVLRLKSGKKILLFDHWGKPVLRNENIQILYKNTNHQELRGFSSELIVNLEAFWQKDNAREDDLKSIQKVFKAVEKFIKPSLVATLVGKAPALLFLLTQHLLYGKTGEIWYQESTNSAPTKITHL